MSQSLRKKDAGNESVARAEREFEKKGKRSGTLVGAVEISLELAGWRKLQLLRPMSYFLSIMQEDVCIGYTALTLMLGLQVFSSTGLPRLIDYLAPALVCHIKMEASR